MGGKYQKGRQNVKTANSGNKLRVAGGEVGGGWSSWVISIKRALAIMSTRCYMQLMNP